MGIMMLAVLTLLGMTHIHRMNALKNVLGALINGVAVVAFVVAGAVRWAPGIVMIAGGITGGYAGAAARAAREPEVRALARDGDRVGDDDLFLREDVRERSEAIAHPWKGARPPFRAAGDRAETRRW